MLLILTAFFAHCAAESTTILWASTYLVADRGVTPATAAAFAALFLLGITGGRFPAWFFAEQVGDGMLIHGGFLTVALSTVMILLPFPTDLFALAGLVIAGLGSTPIYPAITHSTPVSFGARNSQAIIDIQMAAAYTDSTLAPPFFGLLAEWTGTWILPFFLIVLVVPGPVISEQLSQVVRVV